MLPALAVLLLLPSVMPRAAQQPRVVMNISLGGAPGPETGGTQMLGGRPDRRRAPSTAPQIAQNPAATRRGTPPKMALPDPRQKPRTPPKPTAASKDPKGTAAGRGVRNAGRHRAGRNRRQGTGVRIVERRRRRRWGMKLDVANFCCPEYIVDMRNRILKNWNQQQQATGSCS